VGKYLNMLAASAGKPRYNPLNGEIMGEVTAEEAAHAKAVMDERRAKRKAAKGDSVLAQPVQTGTESA
jgi:sRNA-binding protein